MLFSEEDSPLLKKWIIKRLEQSSSDADADILADYLLALLRHDADIAAVRQLCEAEMPAFLNADSATFIQDVFDAIQYKSYLPGAAVSPQRQSVPFAPPAGPSLPSYGNLSTAGAPPLGPLNGGRKRSYNDRGDGDAQDRSFGQNGDYNARPFKQTRRGGQGRGNFDNFNNGRGGGFSGHHPPPMNIPGMEPQGFPGVPPMPSPPVGIPAFDPQNPMAALLAMQAMGFMPPGMPDLSQSHSAGTPHNTGAPPGLPRGRRLPRCRDYEERGFCPRGVACKFQHGDNTIVVPKGNPEEYDPTSSGLLTQSSEWTPGDRGTDMSRGRGNDRGRGRGRGDRGGTFNNARKNGRSDLSSDRPNFSDKTNTSIVVENIPEESFSEEAVRAFFEQFGQISDVEMRPYKRLAVVKFTEWDVAFAAYKSPKVIFDNRFVKVYWFKDQASLPQPPSDGTIKKDPSSNGPFPARSTSEPQLTLEENIQLQEEKQKRLEQKAKDKQENEAKKKEIERLQENLLKSHAEEKRKLMERLAAKGQIGSTPIESANDTATSGEAKPTTQTEALKAQLALLEAEAKSLGIDPTATDDAPYNGLNTRGGHRGRGGYRGRGAFVPRGARGGYRGRGGAPFAASGGAVYKLDNRPKTVSLRGIDFSNAEKDENLRQYLLGIGEYTSLDVTPSLTTVTFNERYIAEKFMYETPGSEIPSVGRVEMAWVKTPLPPVNLATLKVAPIAGQKQGQDDVHMADEVDTANLGGSSTQGPDHRGYERNLDYDVAGDDEWGT